MDERLQKIIAAAGIASRRKSEDLILQGRVTLNGKVVTELGRKADPGVDHVKVDGRRIQAESLVYFAVNKPVGVLSSASDDRGRKVVTQLVPSQRRLYPAGRLDYNSEGLIILTNDGPLTRRITQSGKIGKTYRVKVQGVPEDRKLSILRKGARLDGLKLAPCSIRIVKRGGNCWLEVVLRQGKNRQIRQMFERIGHRVMRLRRVSIGPVQLGELKPGAYRRMTPRELRLIGGGESRDS